MAERRSRSRTRRTTLDLENPSNWTVNQLREKLQGLGIWTPTTLSRTFLIQMYRENKALNQNTTVTFNTPNEIRSRPSTDMPTALCREVPETADAQTAAQSDTNASVHLPTTTTMAAPMTLMMECINELKNTVNRLVETNSGQRRLQASSTPSPAPTSYTLYTAIEAEKSRDIDSTPRGMFTEGGVSPENLPMLDLVSAPLRKQIIEGRDINLASLLIPEYEVSQCRTILTDGLSLNLRAPQDPRLSRQLGISEFITAFGKYKRILSAEFPYKRDQLDKYEAIIIELHNMFGDKFYEYHRIFAARSWEALREHNIRVNWAIRDKELINRIMAGTKTNTCDYCGSITHTSRFL
ncbi:uncharacterized protein LOC110452522 isoform X2 [Mizuhopecten yessoensis]|uniref:uncharacterized protein LOC110452522 isoform X2 n=1 Tax=Mizuhopecten yessoensis TaxID=6573 RepID=UPI000B45B419|nr:uncharacterized protein LOC110452522 isoform X2 [Mizuhopecten yessoensis]